MKQIKQKNEALQNDLNKVVEEKEKMMPKSIDRYNFLNEEKSTDEKEKETKKVISGKSVDLNWIQIKRWSIFIVE